MRAALTAAGGWLCAFAGGADGLLRALAAFMALDYATGVMRAIAEKKLSSAAGFRGICRKALIIVFVGMAHLADTYALGGGGALRGAVICFYLSNEGLSVLENAVGLGLPVPEKLKDALAQLSSRSADDADGRED